MIGPTPGTEASRSSFSRQAGEPRTLIVDLVVELGELLLQHADHPPDALAQRACTAIAPARWRSAADHLDDLAPAGDEIGKQSASPRQAAARSSGLVASAKRAITAASIGSVLARWPTAWAKARTWAGLTTTTGRAGGGQARPPPPSRSRRSPPSRSCAATQRPQPLDQAIQTGCVAATAKPSPPGRTCNVQAVFRDVDADNDDVHRDPSLPNRARFAAQATVRVRWNGERGAELTCGLARPRGYRAPARHRDPDLMRVAAMRVTRGFGLNDGL